MNDFQPTATFFEGLLCVQLRETTCVRSAAQIDIIMDIDDTQTPCGVEILHLKSVLGEMAAEFPTATFDSDAIVRSSYDPDIDAATIGVDLGKGGNRVLYSVPTIARVGIDADGRLVCIKAEVRA